MQLPALMCIQCVQCKEAKHYCPPHDCRSEARARGKAQVMQIDKCTFAILFIGGEAVWRGSTDYKE